jgi:pyridoxal phosphate enzyme (YggS family)
VKAQRKRIQEGWRAMTERLDHSPGAAQPGALATRLHAIRERIGEAASRVNRAPDDIALVAVSKTVPVEVLRDAYALGLRAFGENRVQEAQEKVAALALPDIRWELIGHLQTNKANRAADLFARVQSVDSFRLAEALSARATALGKTLPILLEVNVAGEASKSGFAPEEILEAARRIAEAPSLRLEGLMTIAPLVDDPEEVRPVFRALRELRNQLREAIPLGADGGWPELSMGMSDDFAVAIEEGATQIRLGRALFGARPTQLAPPGVQ